MRLGIKEVMSDKLNMLNDLLLFGVGFGRHTIFI